MMELNGKEFSSVAQEGTMTDCWLIMINMRHVSASDAETVT